MYTTPEISNKYNLRKIETNHIRNQIYDEFMNLKNCHQFKLYHLTVTWQQTYKLNPYEFGLTNHLASKEVVLNDQFTRFYIRNLVPYLIDRRRVGTSNRHLQPIAVCFLEDSDCERKKSVKHFGNRESLHHHCLIAAKDGSELRLKHLSGVDTFKNHFRFFDRSNSDEYKCIYSSDLKEITNTEVQVDYPSKKLWKFREKTMLKFNYPIDYDRLNLAH